MNRRINNSLLERSGAYNLAEKLASKAAGLSTAFLPTLPGQRRKEHRGERHHLIMP